MPLPRIVVAQNSTPDLQVKVDMMEVEGGMRRVEGTWRCPTEALLWLE